MHPRAVNHAAFLDQGVSGAFLLIHWVVLLSLPTIVAILSDPHRAEALLDIRSDRRITRVLDPLQKHKAYFRPSTVMAGNLPICSGHIQMAAPLREKVWIDTDWAGRR
jgi:hypothetical protein